jgi:hypothetical protein
MPAPGQLFSRLYLQPTEPTSDSLRFRSRIASYLRTEAENVAFDRSGAASLVQQETGAKILRGGTYWPGWEEFLLTCELPVLLDTITLIYWLMKDGPQRDAHSNWKTFVERVLREECLTYKLDEECGVLRLVDEEFERNHESLVRGLETSDLVAVRQNVERAYDDLAGRSLDTRSAVRNMFEAAETLTKLLLHTNKDLSSGLVQAELRPALQRAYAASDSSAAAFSATMVESFSKWVDAGHKYRHGPKSEIPHAPPLELAVLYLSQGASHIRWLVAALRENL